MKRKLSLMALLMALVLVLAACGGGESSDSSSDEGEKTEKEEAKEDDKEEAKEEEKEEAKEEKEEAPAVGGDTLATTLWDVAYDANVWSYDKEYMTDMETMSEVAFEIPGATDDDAAVVKVTVSAYLVDPSSFRDALYNNELDEYEYAVNNAYDRVEIGGVEFVKVEGEEWGSPVVKYFARNEAAKATVFITISGEVADERVSNLISGLTFKLEDVGNVDPPWPWDGERFTAENKSQLLGTIKVNSEYIPFEKSLITRNIFDQAIGVVDNKAYVVSDKKLFEYDFDGTSLKFVKEHEVDGQVEAISVTDDGSIWLSGFLSPLLQMKDGEVVASYDADDTVAMHPSGTWGIAYFTEAKLEKL